MGKDLVCEMDIESVALNEHGCAQVGTITVNYKNNAGEEVTMEKTLEIQMGREQEEIREVMKH